MLNRRRFIRNVTGGAAALAGSSVFPPSVLGANDRVRFGLIGAGGRGMDIFKHALRSPNTQAVAVADVYTRRQAEAKKLAPTIQTFSDFRRLLASADAVIISSPEYAHGMPGSLKNALDWLVSDGTLVGKPVLIITTAPTRGEFAHAQLVEVLTTMQWNVLTGASLLLRKNDDFKRELRASLTSLAAKPQSDR